MAACLFGRSVYTDELLSKCLHAVGYSAIADNVEAVSRRIQRLRWRTRLATGLYPREMMIPKRFTEIHTWRGPVDGNFLQALKNAYADRIIHRCLMKSLLMIEMDISGDR